MLPRLLPFVIPLGDSYRLFAAFATVLPPLVLLAEVARTFDLAGAGFAFASLATVFEFMKGQLPRLSPFSFAATGVAADFASGQSAQSSFPFAAASCAARYGHSALPCFTAAGFTSPLTCFTVEGLLASPCGQQEPPDFITAGLTESFSCGFAET